MPENEVVQPAGLPVSYSPQVTIEHPGVFVNAAQFETGQRMAKALASSDMVPPQYKNNLANCIIAVDIAQQRGISPLAVMQNLAVIQGRPAWAATFIIASINASGLFSPLRYEWTGVTGQDGWGCRAVATDLRSGERIEGTLITIAMAKAEGWYGRNGSKWQTMPEQMLRYRAGSFFGRIYAGHILLGLPSVEEVIDAAVDVTPLAASNPFVAGQTTSPAPAPASGPPAAPEPRRRGRRAAQTIEHEDGTPDVPPGMGASLPEGVQPFGAEPSPPQEVTPASAVGNEGPRPGPTPTRQRPAAPAPEPAPVVDDPLF